MTRRAAIAVLLCLLLALLLTACAEKPAEQPPEVVTEDSDAELPPEAEGRTIITVGVLFAYDYTDARVDVNAFNEAQDEVWAVLKTYMDPETEQISVKAGLQRMYADLASGDRPDLYHMPSVDAAVLRKGGYLSDWYPLMEADPAFRMEDYQTHIWELLETDGHLYQLCSNFDLYGLELPQGCETDQTGWTLEEFEDWRKENDLTIGRERLLQLMLWYGTQFEYIDLETKTCQFETPAFYDWLAYLQTLPEDKSWNQSIRPGHIGGPDGAESHYRMEGYYRRVVGLPTQRRSGPGVSIRDSYGLASDTEHPEACWAFARWLLSKERVDDDTVGIPIRRDAWESQLYRAGLDGSHEESLFYGNTNLQDWNKPYPAMPEEEIEYLRDSVANVDYVSLGFFDYEDVAAIVEEEVLAYLAGDKSAEECARIIQSRVSVLLAEQN